MVVLSIPLEPVGQRRARHGRPHGQPVTYKDAIQARRETDWRLLMASQMQRQGAQRIPLGAIRLTVKAYKRIPPSRPGCWQREAESGQVRPTTTPDLDNILKHIKDCLTGLAWTDDRQVVEYGPGTGCYYSRTPHVDILIEQLESDGSKSPARASGSDAAAVPATPLAPQPENG